MTVKSDIICVDAGNTLFKMGIFRDDQSIEFHRVEKDQWAGFLNNINPNSAFAISSVLDEKETGIFFGALENRMILNRQHKLPIQIDYQSPETLGFDRICNAVAARKLSASENVLVIDIGTCIKFDFVQGNSYKGGSISPGINLRYRTLNEFTGKLPLINEKNKVNLLAYNTKDALNSGVINGMQGELNFFLQNYTAKFEILDIYITGGDAQYFDFPRKNNIFANENLTLEGIHQIYLENA